LQPQGKNLIKNRQGQALVTIGHQEGKTSISGMGSLKNTAKKWSLFLAFFLAR
jgi:hypothetical protein